MTMMLEQVASGASAVPVGVLRDEMIGVYLAVVRGGESPAAVVEGVLGRSREGATVVMELPAGADREVWAGAIRAAAAGGRGVFVSSEEDPRLWGGEMAGLANVHWEPDAAHAVIGTMQLLRAGDTLVIFWPEEGAGEGRSLLARGARRRSRWEDEEFPMI